MYKSSSCFDLPGLGIVNHFNVYCSIYLGYLFRISCGFDFSFLRWLEMLSFLSCTYCHLWGCFLRLSFQIFNSIIYLFIYLFIYLLLSHNFLVFEIKSIHACSFANIFSKFLACLVWICFCTLYSVLLIYGKGTNTTLN
jgi:hypothetical protein